MGASGWKLGEQEYNTHSRSRESSDPGVLGSFRASFSLMRLSDEFNVWRGFVVDDVIVVKDEEAGSVDDDDDVKSSVCGAVGDMFKEMGTGRNKEAEMH